MTLQEKIDKHTAELEDMRSAYSKLGDKIVRKADFISRLQDDMTSGSYQKFLESTFETADWDYILDLEISPLTRRYDYKEYNNSKRKIAELFGDSRGIVEIETWASNEYTHKWQTLGALALTEGREDIFRTVISRACAILDFDLPDLESFSDGISKDGHICITLRTDDLSESGILYLFVNKDQTSFIIGKQKYRVYRDMYPTDNIDDLIDWMVSNGHTYSEY